MKLIRLILISLLFTSSVYGQKLRNIAVNVSMNAAATTIAEVYDAAYIPALNKYIIVGNFQYVNGIAKNRIAFLNADGSFSPTNPASFPITTIDGDINCVEVVQNNIFLGGDFTTINGSSSPAFRKVLYNSGTGTYSLDSWIPFTTAGFSVHDMCTNSAGSRVALVGNFDEIYNGSGTLYSRINIAEISSTASTIPTSFSSFSLQYDPNPYSGSVINRLHIKFFNNDYYISGAELSYNSLSYSYSLMRISSTGVFEKGYEAQSGAADFAQNFDFFSDSLMIAEENWNMGLNLQIFYPGVTGTTNYNLYNQTGASMNSSTFNGYGLIGDNEGGLYAVNDLLNNGSTRLQHLKYSGIENPGNAHRFDADTTFVLNVNATDFDPNNSEHLQIANDKLFVSSSVLTGAPTQASKGLLIYCLPPYASGGFDNNYTALPSMDMFGNITYPPKNVDSIVCPGNIKPYGLKPVKLASGYKYTVTGNNIKYGFSTALNSQPSSFSPLPANGIVYQPTGTTFANQIWLQFGDGFTGGSVKVEPYNTCNNSTDYLYGAPSVTNFTLAPLPNIQIPTEVVFDCTASSETMVITSSNSNISTEWQQVDGSVNTTGSYTINSSIVGPNDSIYILASVIENTGNQCRATDSTLVFKNEITPDLISLTPGLIWNCYSDTIYYEVSDTNTSYMPGTAIISYATNLTGPYTVGNPAIIDHQDTVFFMATYPSNGCTDYFSDVIFPDMDEPTVHVSSIPVSQTTFDTITCLNPSVTMSLYADSAGVQTYWFYENDTIPNTLTVDMDDPYYDLANTTNAAVIPVYYYYGAFDPDNGCSTLNPIPIRIEFDVKSPQFVPFSGDSVLSCSEDTLHLVHDEVFGEPYQGWMTNDGNNLNDTASVISAVDDGIFVYQITGNNGCVSYDSVTVDRTNLLEFAPNPDFWVCPEEPFTVSSTALGQGPFTYSWNGGQTSAVFNGIGGTDTELIVNATDGVCNGSDTIRAQITDPITATFIGYQECGNNGSIQVDTVYGGAASNITDYMYSFNNGPFTTTNYFPVSEFAEYPFAIKDTLGCIYDFQTVLEGELQTPDCNFLASTYNVIGDTVFIVDVTLFQGFDSVAWSSLANVEFIDASNNNAMITTLDSGWVEVIFTGYIYDTISTSPLDVDTCSYPFSKSIYFGEFGANLDTTEVINGINNLTVFPNPQIYSPGAQVTLTFELGVEQEYYIFSTNTIGGTVDLITDHDTGVGLKEYQFTLGSLTQGTYLIHVLSNYGSRQVKLVIQ